MKILKKDVCPNCGQTCVLVQGKNLEFWRCIDGCKRFFDDDDGKIFPPEKCPKCEKGNCFRFISGWIIGGSYWRCYECETYFEDDHRFLGEEFSDENSYVLDKPFTDEEGDQK